MADNSPMVQQLLERLKVAREAAGMTPEELANDLILGPGWIERFESGESIPDIDTLFVLMRRIGIQSETMFAGLLEEAEDSSPAELNRLVRGEQDGDDLVVHFQYANYDAKYRLADATVEELEEVFLALRNGLARLVATDSGDDEKQIKTNAVAAAFLKAVELWPSANPSDLWWFVVYRAFCDPYNHPAQYARLSFEQSWKRTGGWALEEIVVRHYGPTLKKRGLNIEIATGKRKNDLLSQLDIGRKLITDKVDVILTGPDDEVFGVIHVKASFAERRTDDVPMSEALVKTGYFSPLWTMDCKSVPSANPNNRGELGTADGSRSEKRIGIENDGEFSACYSYNHNTKATIQDASKTAAIVLCDFNDPDDAFVQGAVAGWENYKSRREERGR